LIATLEDYRQFYAEEIRVAAGVRSEALVRAFARVPREQFLGPGPWKLGSMDSGITGTPKYRPTPDADPRHVYHNVVIAIDETRHLNNGQPGSLAAWIDALELTAGERVVHIGAGVGYYSALMAEVVGPSGRVAAVEVDPELAARARRNLAAWKNAEVIPGDGSSYDPGPADAIFVNAGVTHPWVRWLDSLKPGGRLLYPVTFESAGFPGGRGCMVLVKREGERYSARSVSFVMIYSCSGLRDPELNAALLKQISSGKLFSAQCLRRDRHEVEDTCLAHAKDSCLSSKPA
jgi:protein-L-isoaspartate(D-aspartate) O-methyltransferase